MIISFYACQRFGMSELTWFHTLPNIFLRGFDINYYILFKVRERGATNKEKVLFELHK